MTLFMTIEINVFINIFLFTIIDCTTRKNRKLRCINRLKKKWNESLWCMKTSCFVDFLNFFFFHEFFASFYDNCLHEWNMLWFLSTFLKISENYHIRFIIKKKLCQTKRSSFLINFETSLNTRDEKYIIGIWRKSLRRNSNLDENLNTIDDIYSFSRSFCMFSLNFWLHFVRFRKNHSKNY